MNRFKIILLVVSIISACLYVIFALDVFPIPGTDSYVFLPAAYNLSVGRGFTNALYYVVDYTDPTGKKLFNYYLPFFPMMLGWLSAIKPGMKTIFFICAIMNGISILLYTRILANYVKGQVPLMLKVGLLFSIPYLGSYLVPTCGRPENFTILFALLLYILWQRRSSMNAVVYQSIVCLILSMMAASQLMSLVFSFTFLFIADTLAEGKPLRVIAMSTGRLVIATGLGLLWLAVSPNGLADTIRGIKVHTAFLDRQDDSLEFLFRYWVTSKNSFGYVVLFASAAMLYLQDVWRNARKLDALSKAMVLLGLLVAAFGMKKFVLYGAPTIYNVTQFILPMCLFIAVRLIHMSQGLARQVHRTLVTLVFVAGSFFFIRVVLLYADYKADGYDFDTMQQTVLKYQNSNKRIFVSSAFWSLATDLKKIKIPNYGPMDSIIKSGDVVIYQQAYIDIPEDLLKRSTIIEDHRTRAARKVLGLPLTNRPQGYSCVVLRVN